MNQNISNFGFLKYDTIKTYRLLSLFPKYLFFVRLDTLTNADSVMKKLSNFNVKYLHIMDENFQQACTTTYNDPALNTSCGDAISQNDKNWPLINLDAACAHDITKGDGQVVGIIDTWFTDAADVLTNRQSITKYPLTGPRFEYYDEGDHGTECASFAFAKTNNNSGIASLGYNIKYNAYSLGKSENVQGVKPKTEDFIAAINKAVADNNKVITMSIHLALEVEFIKEIIKTKGVTFVLASGNTGIIWWPEFLGIEGAIVVGATKENDNFPPQYGHYPAIDVCAPGFGVRIISASVTNPASNCVFNGDGTSFSAPMVAALIGLMRSVDPSLTPYEIECILKNTCDPITNASSLPLGEIGAGRINAYKAVKMVQDNLAVTHSGTLSSSQTWTGDIFISDDLIIPSGIELTIDDATVRVREGKSIKVQNGGKLIIDFSTLGETFGCSTTPHLWEGIMVNGGGNTQPQKNTPAGVYLSGRVVIQNNSVIKNARYGVSLGESSSSSGGVVQTYNSTFKNCRFSIFFPGYISPTQPDKNYSIINETKFIWDAMLYGFTNFNTHIWMADVKGINITGCKFSNTVPKSILGEYDQKTGELNGRGRGIGAWNCSFNVMPSDDPLTASSGSCNFPDGIPCEFNGLEIGVHSVEEPYIAAGSKTNKAKIVISECVFTDNIYGTHFSNDYRSIVYNSVFIWDGAFSNFARTTPDKPIVSFGITHLNSQGLKNTDNTFVFGSYIDPYYNFFGIWHNNIFKDAFLYPRHHPGTTVAKNRFISNSPNINSTGHLIENLWTPNIQCNFYNSHLSYGWYSKALPPQNSSIRYKNNGGNSTNGRMDAANIWANCSNSSVTSLDVYKSISGTTTNAFRTELEWNELNPPLYDPINSINCKVNFDINNNRLWFGINPGPVFREANDFCNPSLFIAQSEVYCPGVDGYVSTKDDDPRDPLHGDIDPPQEPLTIQQLESDSVIRDSLFDMLNIADYELLFNKNEDLKNELIGLAELDTRVENQLAAQILIHFYNVIIPQNVGIIAPEAQNGKRQFNANPSTDVILVPNPNKGSFIIKYTEDAELHYNVYNLFGQSVFTNSGFTNTEIKLPDFIASGIYFISLQLKNQPTVIKKVAVYK